MLAPDLSILLPNAHLGVAVSGGADSVALLRLLLDLRSDLILHVIHLDHQTRAGASATDARFVQDLALSHKLSHTVASREQIEPLIVKRPKNRSAFYRALRLELFKQTAAEHNLDGIVLAHHADDQAETILHRLIRGSSPNALSAMSPVARLGSLILYRPLLSLHRTQLRAYLHGIGQDWREDISNESP